MFSPRPITTVLTLLIAASVAGCSSSPLAAPAKHVASKPRVSSISHQTAKPSSSPTATTTPSKATLITSPSSDLSGCSASKASLSATYRRTLSAARFVENDYYNLVGTVNQDSRSFAQQIVGPTVTPSPELLATIEHALLDPTTENLSAVNGAIRSPNHTLYQVDELVNSFSVLYESDAQLKDDMNQDLGRFTNGTITLACVTAAGEYPMISLTIKTPYATVSGRSATDMVLRLVNGISPTS